MNPTDRNLTGLERVIADLQARTYEGLYSYTVIPFETEPATTLQSVIASASLGQLLTMANLETRWKEIKILSVDSEGSIYLTTNGMAGMMDLDGFIHT